MRLEDLAAKERSAISKPYGSAMVRDDYVTEGIPVVRGVNLGQWRFHDDDFVFISERLADTMPGSRLQSGDLVFTHRGSVGQVAMVPRSATFPRYAVSTSQIKVRLDPDRTLPEFYFYWFRSRLGRNSILEGVSTVGVPGLARPVETIKNLRVPHPPLPEQRRIAGVLGALDDLIDTNQRLSTQLYDFIAAVVSRSLAAATSTIPLSETANFVNGKNFTKGASGRGRPVIRTPEVRIGPTPTTVRSSVVASEDNVTSAGDILFVWSGSLLVSRWEWEDGLVNQHIFKVIPKDGYPAWLAYSLIQHQMTWFLSLAADKATTMGHIQRRHLDAHVPKIDPTDVARLDVLLSPLWNQALASSQEAGGLRRTRDELLPLLMSGSVSPGEIGAAV